MEEDDVEGFSAEVDKEKKDINVFIKLHITIKVYEWSFKRHD